MSIFNIESPKAWIDEVFPSGLPEKMESQELLRENTLDWIVSRKRLLKAGIRNADEKQVLSIVRDYAYLLGINKAFQIFMDTWGDVVGETLEMPEDDTDENDDQLSPRLLR